MKNNYFTFNTFKDKYLITNELGFYFFLNKKDFANLVCNHYEKLDDNIINSLKERFFIYDTNDDVFVDKASRIYRENKKYVFSATCLHIFVMTNICNMNCVYCQAQDSSQKKKGCMDYETARKAVEIALQAPVNELTFEFQGGEPLSNFEVIKYIIEYAEDIKNDKKINYSLVTNTLLITDDILDFLKSRNVAISTSLDGDEFIHNANRPLRGGEGTYSAVKRNIKHILDCGLNIGAIQTTTRKSLSNPKAIVDAYIENGLHYLFLRPLTPLGYASECWDEIGYRPEEFIEFYKSALDEIIVANKSGYYIAEGHASIFLRKILTQSADNYMELRSPCGASIGQLAYYYDGKIYTCDEARMLSEMGVTDFCVGDVDCSYDELVESRVCKVTCQASVIEGIPQCCDCVYHPYCGVCPVVNYAKEQNLYSRMANNYRCKIYKGILDIIFEYLEKDDVVEIFKKWL